MKDLRRLAHTKWDCKYHLVLIPKYRHKVFFAKSRKRGFTTLHFLIRGYRVSTVGLRRRKGKKIYS